MITWVFPMSDIITNVRCSFKQYRTLMARSHDVMATAISLSQEIGSVGYQCMCPDAIATMILNSMQPLVVISKSQLQSHNVNSPSVRRQLFTS